MNRKIKILIVALMILLVAVFVASCSDNPYENNDENGYTVSVKFDANGGAFTTNTTRITYSYDISKLKTNKNGKKEISLIAPEDEDNGKSGTFTASNPGYFLAGWYTERTPLTDENGKEIEGAYKYSGRWDFENGKLEIDPNKTHTSSESVITLYAGWIPEFAYEFYDVDSGKKVGDYKFNPVLTDSTLVVPTWDAETGTLTMGKFPKVTGKTLEKIYFDKAGENNVSDKVTHHGTYDLDNLTSENGIMKLYIDYKDGEWYKIYNLSQFLTNASTNGSYEIYADLDFNEVVWPSVFTSGTYTGKIIGNGHTISNVSIEQTDKSNIYFGMFGQLASKASIENLNITGAKLTIAGGSRFHDAGFGLLAGSIASETTLTGVTVTESKVVIDPADLGFLYDDYSLGLLCGIGYENTNIDVSDITCEALADKYEITIATVTVNGNEIKVTLESAY
ncbi:MAG: hypothetical protein IJ398_02770 [Clostridia bacterium]|nr:hypothetical protein [Clostridia bacterium]